MKKLTLLLAALAFAVTASAAVNFNGRPVKNDRMKLTPKIAKLEKAKRNQLRAPITDQPAGELKTYQRSGEMVVFDSYYGYVYPTEQTGKVSVVYAEDGKTVYVKDLVGGITTGAWVQGTISDDGTAITVPMGQELYYSSTYQASIVLAWGSTYFYDDVDEDGEPVRYIDCNFDETVQNAVFTIDGTTISLENSKGDINQEDSEAALTGTGLTGRWTDDDSWAGYMDWKTVFTEYDSSNDPVVITEQPEGQEVNYSRTGGAVLNSFWYGMYLDEQSGKAKAVFDTNRNVYLKDIVYGCQYGTWVAGTIDANYSTVTVPLGQYLYYSDEYEYGVKLAWATMDVDAEGNVTLSVDDTKTEAVFSYDSEDGTMVLQGSSGDLNADFPTSFTGLYAFYDDDESLVGLDFNTVLTELHVSPAVPGDPTVDTWTDSGDEDGYSRFRFTLNPNDVDGNALDPELISYSVYTDDDQLFNFTADVYEYDLTEDLTEIPYEIYSNGYDFYASGPYFYRTNAEGFEPFFSWRIGVQEHYTVNGVKNSSNIVYLDVFPHDAVAKINAGKTVAKVNYFNAAGQQVSEPSGVAIAITTYTDGTVSVSKVIK